MKSIAKATHGGKSAARVSKDSTREKVLPVVFTVRDMNRATTMVLKAARQHGRVIIRSRGGEEYAISRLLAEKALSRPEGMAEDFSTRQLRYREQMRALDGVLPSAKDMARLNRIIAGEE